MSVIRMDPISLTVSAPRFDPTVAQVMGLRFPSVLKVSEDGATLIIAASADLIIWVKDGRIHQTWKRNP